MRSRSRPYILLAALPLAMAAAGCDTDTAQLIEEIDAAREGCSEEQLKAGDEACVQMFERYAEMGEDAIETYIGGMKALDEALRRRGGIRFDTAGLGEAISDSLFFERGPAPTDVAPRESEDPWIGDRIGPRRSGPGDLGTGAGWETTADRDARLGPADGAGYRGGDEEDGVVAPRRRAPAEIGGTTTPTRRGGLLPPEERLRRPWIGDEPAPTPYLGNGDRRAIPPAARPAPPAEQEYERFEEPIPPYPRE